MIDDGSTDGTGDLLLEATFPDNVTLVRQPKNAGKGVGDPRRARRTRPCEFTAILDADLEYRASDLGVLLEPLLAGDTNVVFGTRVVVVARRLQLLVRRRQQGA